MSTLTTKQSGQLGKRERELGLFFLRLLLIWLSWKGIIFILGEQKVPIEERMFPAVSQGWEQFNTLLVQLVLSLSEGLLELLGYNAHHFGRNLWIDHVPGIGMGNYCLGLQLIYYFTMLILVTPMSLRRKGIGVLTGILITTALNVVRMAGLVLVAYHAPEYLDLFHDHLFNIAVLGSLFVVYLLLVKTNSHRSHSASIT